MKKIIFLSFAALFFAAAANAQSADTSANAGHKKAWHKKGNNANSDFYKKLNLNDDQKAQLKTINDDQKTKIAGIKSNSSLTDDQKKDQIKAAKTDAYNKRQAIYTPEQKAVIKEDHQQHKGHSGKHTGDKDNSGASDNSGN